MKKMISLKKVTVAFVVVLTLCLACPAVFAANKKPNILVIMPDDVGWFNPTRMHVWTHLKEESRGVTGQGLYADGLAEHDGHVGQLLKKLDNLGIADNTIVVWTTDNGAEVFSWPDGGTTPFAGEKNTNWEGGYRVPMMVRWPNKIKADVDSNEVVSMEDWAATLMAAVGEADIREKLLKGHNANGKTFKVHLDSYNLLPYLTGKEDKVQREEFLNFLPDGFSARYTSIDCRFQHL